MEYLNLGDALYSDEKILEACIPGVDAYAATLLALVSEQVPVGRSCNNLV